MGCVKMFSKRFRTRQITRMGSKLRREKLIREAKHELAEQTTNHRRSSSPSIGKFPQLSCWFDSAATKSVDWYWLRWCLDRWILLRPALELRKHYDIQSEAMGNGQIRSWPYVAGTLYLTVLQATACLLRYWLFGSRLGGTETWIGLWVFAFHLLCFVALRYHRRSYRKEDWSVVLV